MKKIIDFCKKQYKLLIPLMVVLVLLITIYFLYREYKYDNYRDQREVSVYQYFGGIRHDYTAIVTYNLRKAIIDIKAKDKKINYDATPVYYADEDKIIFPHEMGIAFPLKQGSQYKLTKYSLYEVTDNKDMLHIGTNALDFDYFFLFDGEGLYFFPSEVTLQIDGEDYVTLGAMSFINYVGGATLTYYNKEKNEAEFLEVEGKKINVSSKYININLTDENFQALSSTILLMPLSNLNAIK